MHARKSTAPVVDAPSADDIAELASTVSHLMRTFARARQQFLAHARTNVEWSAQLLISAAVNEGPLRVSALAEIVQSDVSTVSRQVAPLVKDGYLERRADPTDGRASLLVATPQGLELHQEHLKVRNEHFRRMLDEWNERDVRRFSALLRRFTDDFSESRKAWFDEVEQPGPEAAATPQKEN